MKLFVALLLLSVATGHSMENSLDGEDNSKQNNQTIINNKDELLKAPLIKQEKAKIKEGAYFTPFNDKIKEEGKKS